ncbi:Riboflavin synthase alpha chain [Bachmanniomyces sp. S44760]|nr:Riboflavin synthase alpha chain [Bachmanniomyces sp. S44760]
MFTGIVETIGTVSALESQDDTSSGGGGTSLTITDCEDILTDAKLGDSISINGTCLTITALQPPDSPRPTSFSVGISPETLRRTNLGRLIRSSPLNLERAVGASTRMGGHFVQGHVDTVATVISVTPDGNARTFRLRPRRGDEGILRYVVEKGYVTLDGASLTITNVFDGGEREEGWWEVMLIAYTQERVVMGEKKAGEEVNVEVDMVGKYVEKSVRGYFEGLEGQEGGSIQILEKMVGRMVNERLKTVDGRISL